MPKTKVVFNPKYKSYDFAEGQKYRATNTTVTFLGDDAGSPGFAIGLKEQSRS